MKVRGLDGREYVWKLRGLQVGRVDGIERSGLHLAVRKWLRSTFPTEPILEEVPLPGSGGLTADFYLPVRRLMVEANGEQHRSRVPHFQPTVASFHAQQDRDRAKGLWAEANGIRVLLCWHFEDEAAWTAKLLSGSGSC